MSLLKHEIETYFGRCRCCLSYGYLKNMWTEHEHEGEREVYGEMLVQCFALSWDHSDHSIEQDQICEQCVIRLRDASEFKKVVLNSQDEFSQQIDAENGVKFKIESVDEEFMITYGDQDTADTHGTRDTLSDIGDTADTTESVKEEIYEEIEYLEDDELGEANQIATDSSNEVKNQSGPLKRRTVQQDENTDDGVPKRKWPKRLPKDQRLKTYKQYSEETLRQCMDVVRKGDLTPSEAALKYNIPKKTICSKLKQEPSDVPIDNTTKSTNKQKLEQGKKKQTTKLTIFKDKAALDADTKKMIEEIKIKAKLIQSIKTKLKDSSTAKDQTTFTVNLDVKPKGEDIEEVPVDAEQVRTRYKAIVNKKFKKKNKEPEKCEVNEMIKHKDNIKAILQNSNATVLKGFWGIGYSCCFCDVHKKMPSELKQHNLESHTNAGDKVIKVKYVSDLVIRLDITDLKCNVCEESIDSLEAVMEHLSKVHSKVIHTDVKNHIIPFKFNTDSLQCVMCKRNFKYFKLLSEHMSEHYRNYECSVCDRAFINKQSMQTHSYRHRRGVFKCAHCPKVFDTRPKRSVHERVVHALSNKTRKCTFCDKRFSTKDLVQSHEVKEHGVKPTLFSCQACNKCYSSQSSLITHRNRYHLMLRPHKCSHCEMAFFSKIELRSHIVTHTGTRDFKCDICSKTFGTRCSLNQHVRGHLDDRRFKCENCGRTFVHRTAWKIHMRSKHGKIV